MKIRIELAALTGLIAQIVVIATAMGQSPSTGSQPPLMDRQREIALAQSACPQDLASKAAVYVLEKSGHVKVRESQNGFTAMVQHVLPDSVEPICMNAEATRTRLPRIQKIAELRAQGKDRDEISRTVADALAKGVYQWPTRPSVTYMLSTQNLPSNEQGTAAEPFPPHVMFWVPYVTNADLGLDGNPNGLVSVARAGTPDGVIIVPVAMHAEHQHAENSP